MKISKEGCFNFTWNGIALFVFIISTCSASYSFLESDEPTNQWLRNGSLFLVISTAFYTAYQVWRSTDSFPNYATHELFAISKAIGGAAQWVVHRVQGHVTVEHEKTRGVRSVEYGLKLLKDSEWVYRARGFDESLYCVDDTDWIIILDEESRRPYSGYETWFTNFVLSTTEAESYRVVLKRGDVEIIDVKFIALDNARFILPQPRMEGIDTFYYCENGIEHLLFRHVRKSLEAYMGQISLKELATRGQIEWRKC